MTGRQNFIFPKVTLGLTVVIGAAIATTYANKSSNVTEESGHVSLAAYSENGKKAQEVHQDGDYNGKTFSNSTKFRACEKTPEEFKYYGPEKGNHLATYMKGYRENNCTKVLQGTKFSKSTYATINNGFVNTVLNCYIGHHNLVIRPDDVWTAILTQFSFYINANSEEFRKQFVSFEGKKTLTVTLPGSLYSAPYDLFITKMTEKIDENLIDKEIKDWILPNFTTTTKDDIVTSGAIFMATMKNYFNYMFSLTCGIPWITLEGTVADWQEILRRSEKLKAYKLEKWYNMLQPILKKFVGTKQGNIDLDFYQRICHYESGGSGPAYISGWISAFCVFNSKGTWFGDRITKKEPWPKITTDAIPSGVVEANVIITDSAGK